MSFRNNDYGSSSFWMSDRNDDLVKSTMSEIESEAYDLYKLSSQKKAISNFVSILTGKSLPVKFNVQGMSYTDGENVVISSKLSDPKDFDVACGLALHEASHIVLSDFELLKQLKSRLKAIGVYHEHQELSEKRDIQYLSTLKNILNYVEDRRIDRYVFDRAPGYRDYYLSMYDKYFNDRVIDKALVSNEYTDETIESYMFRLINLHSKNSRLDALKGLPEIYKLIDFHNIDRLKSSGDAFSLSIKVFNVMLKHIPETPEMEDQEPDEGQGSNSQESDSNGESSESSGSTSTTTSTVVESQPEDSDEEPDEEPETENTPSDDSDETDESNDSDGDSKSSGDNSDEESEEDSNGGSDGDESDEDSDEDSDGSGKGDESDEEENEDESSELDSTGSNTDNEESEKDESDKDDSDEESERPQLTDRQKEIIKKKIKKQERFLDGDVRKNNITKSQSKEIDVIDETDSEMVSVGEQYEHPGRIRCNNTKTKCIVIKKMTKSYCESKTFPFKRQWYSTTRNEEAISKGLKLGTIIGKKMKVHNEQRTTVFNRQKTGKIDKRMVASLGFGNDSVFYRSETDMYNDVNLHITVDASGSMGGEKWDKTMTNIVSLAKACDMIENIDIQISFRATRRIGKGRGEKHIPIIMIAYDSRKDSFGKVKRLFKYISPTGTTPEGLTFESIEKLMVESSNGLDSYFLNISDGYPMFYNQDISYEGTRAAEHTFKQVKKLQQRGIRVLSYFIHSGENVPDTEKKLFNISYGRTAKFIDVTSASQVAKTMNRLFLEK